MDLVPPMHYLVFISDFDDTEIDIAFLLDGSQVVTKDNFLHFLALIKSTTASLNVSKNGTHVAVAVYGDKANLVIGFNDHLNQSSLDLAVDLITYSESRLSNMGAGLEVVSAAFASNAARPNATHVLVILTSSKSQDDIEVPSHRLLTSTKVNVFTIGFGTEYSNGQLKEISSDPDDSFVVTVNNGGTLPMEVVLFKATLAIGNMNFLRLDVRPKLRKRTDDISRRQQSYPRNDVWETSCCFLRLCSLLTTVHSFLFTQSGYGQICRIVQFINDL